MNINKAYLKQVGIFAGFLLGFWLISVIYLWPATSGKVLRQGDMQQVRLMRDAADKFGEQNGQLPNWNDRVFSGMPSSLITGIPQGSVILKSRPMELFGLVKSPYNFLFVAMFSMFALLMAARVNKWLAAAGAIGYGFMTFSISSYEAGHITKVLAMDVMPGMLAGLVLITWRKYLLGAGVLGLFFSMLVGYFHYQIAYYAGIMAAVYLFIEMILALRAGETRHALIATGLSVVMLGLGAVTNVGKALDTMHYSAATMRGGSAVASEVPQNGPKSNVGKKGLDIEYAFSWSYSPSECFTLLIPGFKGGSSDERVGTNELGADRLPLYFGDLQFTSGPIYAGAVFIFLFMLAIVVVLAYQKTAGADSKDKTVAITFLVFSVVTFIIALVLSWGRFASVNALLFEILPYYNKFRTPMMALVIAQVVIPFFGLYGLQLLMSDKFSAENRKRIFMRGAAITGVLMILAAFIIFGEDFKSPGDAEIAKSSGPEVVREIVKMRSSLVWGDWFRSLALIAMAGGLVYFTMRQKLSKVVMWVGVVVLITFDMMGVAKRYLTEDNWEEKETEVAIEATPKEQKLAAANKENARVFDLRYNPFNDNRPAPFFRNVGGYHPAKLSRYQDIISYCITPNGGALQGDWINNNNALDMLNCRYVFSMSEDRKSEEIYERPTALGHAWFVNQVNLVKDAKTAIVVLNKFNVKREALVETTEKVQPRKGQFMTDSLDVIKQTYYSFDTIKYRSESKADGLAVFSEIYYNEKNGSWKAWIDGKETPVLRANYILRALEVPAGKHDILFAYVPASRAATLTTEVATSSALLLLAVAAIALGAFRKEAEGGTDESDT